MDHEPILATKKRKEEKEKTKKKESDLEPMMGDKKKIQWCLIWWMEVSILDSGLKKREKKLAYLGINQSLNKWGRGGGGRSVYYIDARVINK